MKLTFFLAFALCLATAHAQRNEDSLLRTRPTPRLTYKGSGRPVTNERQPVITLPVAAKNDKQKVLDFSVQHIQTGELQVLTNNLSFDEMTFRIVVRNGGALASKTAYLAISIGAFFKGMMAMSPSKWETVFNDGAVVPPLKPGEKKEFVFDISQAYSALWGKAVTKTVLNPTGYAYLVTEPIVIQ